MGKRVLLFMLMFSIVLYPLLSFFFNQELIIQTSNQTLENYSETTGHVVQNENAPKVGLTLPLYFEPGLMGVPYVDLNEFYNFILPALVQKQDFFVDYHGKDWKLKLNNNKSIQLDFGLKQLLISDIKILDEISSLYQTTIQAFKIKSIKPTTSISISLDAYHIPIDYQDGHYLVPLYLANYLLSGYDLDVMYGYDGEHQLIVSTPDDYFGQKSLDYWDGFSNQLDEESELQASQHSIYFLNLVMEQFYGLKYLGNTYQAIEADLSNSKQNRLYMQETIAKLNDLHTGFIYSSFFEKKADQQDRSSVLLEKEYRMAYSKTQCLSSSLSVGSYYEIDDALYIEIYGFDETLIRFIKDIQPLIDEHKDIFVDIRCNSGGYIAYIATVMKMMEANEWSLISSDLYGGVNEWQFPSNDDHSKKNFYLVTSSYTYSAANLLAAVVAESGSAKVVGQQSFGGAAALDFLSLPDGSVMSYSGPFYIFSTSRFEDIEQGVPVEIPIDFYELANLGATNKSYLKWEESVLNNWKEGFYYYQSPKTYEHYEDYLRRIIEYVRGEE